MGFGIPLLSDEGTEAKVFPPRPSSATSIRSFLWRSFLLKKGKRLVLLLMTGMDYLCQMLGRIDAGQ